MYEILLYKKVEKQLDKLPKETKSRILGALERIRIRPFSFVKRKQGSRYFILRIGRYRAILDISQKKLIIIFIEVGLRGKIYDIRS